MTASPMLARVIWNHSRALQLARPLVDPQVQFFVRRTQHFFDAVAVCGHAAGQDRNENQHRRGGIIEVWREELLAASRYGGQADNTGGDYEQTRANSEEPTRYGNGEYIRHAHQRTETLVGQQGERHRGGHDQQP